MSEELRNIYGKELCKLAESDNRLIVMESDLMGAHGTKVFKEKFPERFIDVGVAEANMVGIAAGLANMGKIPFIHSFTPFATRRVYDQLAVSVGLAKLPVKIVGTDPGVVAELNGQTHMSFEDAGIMRNLPGFIIVEPVDSVQLKKMLPQIIDSDNPTYIRLQRKETENFFNESDDFEIGKIKEIKDGTDVTIITSGIMLKESMNAAKMAEEEGISVKILNMHTLKPVDEIAIIDAAKKTGAVIVAENHSIINGWGSAVAEVLSENYPVPLKRIGIKDHYGEVGPLNFLMEKYGLKDKHIFEEIKNILKRK